MDFVAFKFVNGLSGNAVADAVMTVLARDLAQVLMGIVALLFLVPWTRLRGERRNAAVLATAAAAVALTINQPLGHLIDRARPYVTHPAQTHLLIARSHDPSFPSDHATGAFALAFGIWLYDRTVGTALLVLAAVMAFARVYVGTHYPGDVIAGALMGVGVATLLYLLPTRRALEAGARSAGTAWDTTRGGRAHARPPGPAT
jgi:undecaprenyl-diphosphatase